MAENLVLLVFLLLPPALAGTLALGARRLRTTGRKSSAAEVAGTNLVAVLLIASLFLAAGEIYFRFVFDTTDSIDYTKVSRRWFSRYFSKNSMSFRDDVDYRPRIVPGKRRVSFVGDSFAAGHGVKDPADLFAYRLRGGHPEWEVHLLAILGFDTGGELDMLRQLRSRYEFDQVVLVYCLNDVSDMLPEWKDVQAGIKADAQNAGWLRRNSYFVDIVSHRIEAARNPYMSRYFFFVRDAYEGELWERQKERLAALWSEQEVPHLDLLSVYDGMPSKKLVVGKYDAHPNAYAHGLAAEKIEAFLRANMSFGRPAARRSGAGGAGTIPTEAAPADSGA